MKKILVSLMVLALCVPAMAGTITFGTPVITNGQVDIPWTADEGVVGIALTVTASAGVIDTVVVDSFFDVFVDSAFTDGAGYVYQTGIPTATQGAAGELALPSATFSISVAGLDDDGIGAGTEEALLVGTITMTSDAGATIDVCEDTLRGGVVAYSGAMTIVGLCQNIVIPANATTCYDRLTTAEQTAWDTYIAGGKTVAQMESWCNRFQCRGDADNAAYLPGILDWQIYSVDLNAMIAQWQKTYITNTNPAADFDHAAYLPGILNWTVYSGDLNILIANWQKTPATLVECPGYVAP